MEERRSQDIRWMIAGFLDDIVGVFWGRKEWRVRIMR